MDINFLEKLNENFQTAPNRIVLADDANAKGITLAQLDQISGKVYSFLSSKGIGREDFVLLCLPRGIQPIIGLCGVLKAGAAFVIVEDNYAPERIEFIKKDCGCKIVIDSKVWEEIQHFEYKKGFVPMEEHAAAFAVYTSGTTGNPKGVVHEYGNINRMIQSVIMTTCEPLATPADKFALVAPLNFVASQLIIFYGLYYGIFNYVVAYSIVKNPLYMAMFIIKNGITGTFLTPSYIRQMSKKPPMLRFCIIGSEPANDVYLDGLTIHNFYLMSESGFAVSHFLIDKRYEFTPVGKSEFGHKILLLNEEGKPASEGEICFENDFVRGYMNLPEETAKNFRDGLYHTGDIGHYDENGNIIINGRLNDMVKINGNRVEPAEIENIACKVLNVPWTAAKIFDDGNHVFICVYYKEKLKIDFEKTRKEMEKYLPYYMLPSYFIHIDEIPLRPNGKMDRKALPAPAIDDYLTEYVAPRDDVEKALCESFEKILKVPRVGIHDDFYQLGGDSMASMAVLTESKLSGLSATDIFRGHTPEKIAEIYKASHLDNDGVSVEEKNADAIKKSHMLTAEQLYMVDYQLYTPKSTMYNIFQALKFDKEILDMNLLADAVQKAIDAHPALMTAFSFNEDGEMIQSYRPELFKGVQVEKVTEKEFSTIKDNLVQPFKIVDSCLFRCRIFETEEAGYFFFDVHHTLFDGTSSKVFLADVLKAYAGQDLELDKYYYIVSRREEITQSDFYNESKEYFENRYGKVDWQTMPAVDHETRENEDDEIFTMIPVDAAGLEAVENNYGVSRNGFMISAALIATAIYNRKPDILLSYIYNGRNDTNEMAAIGLLFRNLPAAERFTKTKTLKNFYADVMDQINNGMAHSCYPYVELGASCVTEDIECVLYQDNLRAIDEVPGLLGTIDIRHNKAASQNCLDLEVLNEEDGLVLMLDYASSRYDKESIERYAKIFNTVAAVLVGFNDHGDVPMKKILRKAIKESGEGGFFSSVWWLGWLNS